METHNILYCSMVSLTSQEGYSGLMKKLLGQQQVILSILQAI